MVDKNGPLLDSTRNAALGAMDSTIGAEVGGSSAHLPNVEIGTQVGRYVIRGRLGQGAMGVVYLANDPDLGREVAVKMLKTIGMGDERVGRMRLIREAQALARIAHPNVVGVHDVGISDGMVFLAMEVVEGGTLKAWLARRAHGWQEVLEMFVTIGTGLSAAHQAGLVHRDFKPENVLIAADGQPKVTDFGLVHAAEAALDPPGDIGEEPVDLTLSGSLTRTGMLLGTPAYMSPEQYLKRPLDARSDQFAFCVSLWEALYGCHPFQADTLAELSIAVTSGVVAAPTDGRGAPQWVQDCLRRGMAVQPNARWPTMRALLAALEQRSSFDASRAPRNVRALRLEVMLGVTLVPAFWVLDWFVLPGSVRLTLSLRLVGLLCGLAILAAMRWRPRWVELHVHGLAVSFSLVIAWSIALMCFLHAGYESPYYAGICLLVICVGQLYSWPLRTALLFALGVYAFYMAPLVFGLVEIRDLVAALSNQFFLISMLLVTVAAQRHRRRVEQVEFDANIEQGRLRHQVQTDALTGLYNRARFLRTGAEELERSRRYGQALCLLVVDVDCLRAINEAHGESVGDEVLCAVSTKLVETVRRRDLTGRHGGRFAVLLIESGTAASTAIAKRLHRSICTAPLETSAGPRAVTAKIGLTEISPETETMLEAFAQAEIALHAAKRGGDPIRWWSAIDDNVQPERNPTSHRELPEPRLPVG